MAGTDGTGNVTEIVIGRTESICPECLKVIPAEKTVREQGIYLRKTCPEHGAFEALIWEGSPESYEDWGKDIQPADHIPGARGTEKGCPYDCGLCEEHERRGCCVLLEVTGRCNLRCPVCFAGAGEDGSRDVPMEELERQMEYLMAHGGPFNLQISGGEPTVRDDLAEIIHMGKKKGFTFFQLNTNGLRLAEEPGYAEHLKEAGLSCVFLQFDGVEDSVYQVLRGRALFQKKQEAIDACERAGLGVILVPVVTPGVNEDQVGKILSYAVSRMPVVRGVHFQPISYFGRCLEAQGSYRITIPKLLELIEEQTNGQMPPPSRRGNSWQDSGPGRKRRKSRAAAARSRKALPAGAAAAKTRRRCSWIRRLWMHFSESCITTPSLSPACCFRMPAIWIWSGCAAATFWRRTAVTGWFRSAPTI